VLHKAFLQGEASVRQTACGVYTVVRFTFWPLACTKEARRMFEISRTGLVICRLRLPARFAWPDWSAVHAHHVLLGLVRRLPTALS
jgi:hypothetical protein